MRLASRQNDFSLLNRTYESDTWEAAYRFGVVGLPYGALAGGVLTGKYIDGSPWSKAADADRPLATQHVGSTAGFGWRHNLLPRPGLLYPPKEAPPAASVSTWHCRPLGEVYHL